MIFGLFIAVIMLRATALPEAHLAGGILLMGFGIWLIWATISHSRFTPFIYAPEFIPLVFGLWLIVRGALRFAAY